MKFIVTFLTVLFFSGCSGIRFVSDYDEVIDKGITEFAEKFNAHIKNMGDYGGTQDGTYKSNLETYNALESKLEVLISRASSASEGKGCKLEKRVFHRVKTLLKNDIPVELQPKNAQKEGNSSGCNERLLVLVKRQLSLVREIHRDSDKCGDKELSCLRPATVKGALNIANQSINAVAIVETAKR